MSERIRPTTSEPGGEPGLPKRLIAAVATGMPLTPLNSTMIAVAMVQIQSHFSISLATTSWILTSFYIAAAMGQPLMGGIVDLIGPRRVYCIGLALVTASGVLSPLSPNFPFLVGCRVLLAFGTAAAYPAGMAIYRRESRDGRPPVTALSVSSMAASMTAALGPVLGGFLVSQAGWEAIFLVNIPIALTATVFALRWIPPDRRSESGRPSGLHNLDIAGALCFAIAMTSTLGFLLTVTQRPLWYLLPIAVASWATLGWREMRARQPFIDVRLLRRHPQLVHVLAQFLGVNAVFYCLYYGLPMWMEASRGYTSDRAGLMMLPGALVGLVTTPLAAWLINRIGARRVVAIGMVLMVASSAQLWLLRDTSSVQLVLVTSLMYGLPNSFNNMGLQTLLYLAAPATHTGVAAGMYQSCRYLGAVVSSILIAVIAGTRLTTSGLHHVAVVMVGLAVVLVVASLLGGPASRTEAPR